MRDERELIDRVDVHARTIEARHRLRPANGQQGTVQVDSERGATWWQRFAEKLTWENLIVAGREVKGWVITPGIGAVLLAAILGGFGWIYTSNQGEQRELRDMLVEMKTRLEERTGAAKQAEEKRDREQHDAEETAKVFREKMNERLNDMEYAVGLKRPGSRNR